MATLCRHATTDNDHNVHRAVPSFSHVGTRGIDISGLALQPGMADRPDTLAQAERRALCDLLSTLGPDAPTLCEGWSTLDLAAHLVVRERRPDAGIGILFPPASGWTERVRTRARSQGLALLLDRVRSGPPRWSFFALADGALNTIEYFVHHEDVRRAQPGWEPRALAATTQDELWRRLRGGARLMFRKVPGGLVLQRPDGSTHRARSGPPDVTLVGEPAELVLFAMGRKDHARVELLGDAQAVERVRRAGTGL